MSNVVQQLALGEVVRDQHQPRKFFDHQDLLSLGRNMKSIGQLVPLIVVRSGTSFFLVDGERRWQAAQLVGLGTLNAIVLDHQPNPAELKLMQLTVNCQRADLTPLEKGKAYHEILTLKNWTATQLADSLQLSNSTVTMLLALLKLPEYLQQRVNEGQLDVRRAYDLARIDDPIQQATLAEQVLTGQLSRDALAARVKKQPANSTKTIQKRIAFHMHDGVSICVTSQNLTLERLTQVLTDLSRQVRKAQTQRIAITTLAKQLADQAKSAAPHSA